MTRDVIHDMNGYPCIFFQLLDYCYPGFKECLLLLSLFNFIQFIIILLLLLPYYIKFSTQSPGLDYLHDTNKCQRSNE